MAKGSLATYHEAPMTVSHDYAIEAYIAALQSPDPAGELRHAVTREVEAVGDRDVVLQELEQLLTILHAHGMDDEVVIDAMDALDGWTHPDAAI
jgi:hypothetical protein